MVPVTFTASDEARTSWERTNVVAVTPSECDPLTESP